MFLTANHKYDWWSMDINTFVLGIVDLGFSNSPRIYTHLASVEDNLDNNSTENDYACHNL